jgi:uracil-DNA glycosylase
MSAAARLLAAYLRQREELGEHELLLDDRTGQELLRLLEARPASNPTTQPLVHLEAAAGLASLDAIAAEASACTRCGLAKSRTTVVFGEGDPAADLLVVGEAPGAEEDRTGRPFVGRAGKLLDVLLASVGFPRERVYICNVLKCRPPGNRNPAPAEVDACSSFLHRQVELIEPRAILACGTFSAQTLLATETPIGQLRGGVYEYRSVPLVPTYHPAALLRNPAWIRLVWEDLQRLRALLDR